MGDFDAVLERLLTEASFAVALGTDPVAALAGYRLDADEVALLRSQVSVDPGAHSAVEERVTKSSTFGLLAPVVAVAESFAVQGLGSGPGAVQGLGSGPGAVQGFGSGPAPGGWGGSTQSVGAAVTGLGGPSATTGLGNGGPSVAGLGDAPQSGLGASGTVYTSTAQAQEIAAPAGYHNRVDADGDGTWDRASYRGRAGGGVDILVDVNGDGRTDFVGHDVDADRTVDSADYDKNGDGFFEKRMFDDNGDGWLDRTVRRR
jgi:hypothetical protein